MTSLTVTFGPYTITTDKQLLDVVQAHHWLANVSYWNKGIPFELFEIAFDNSFCIGVLLGDTLVGFARLITDYATFAYLADVFVLEEHRGQGLSKQMMEILMSLDWVRQLRGIKLQTKDAHGLYRQFGFADCKYPERILEVSRPDIYTTTS